MNEKRPLALLAQAGVQFSGLPLGGGFFYMIYHRCPKMSI